MTKPIVFCDFDGTITNSDNIIAVMKRFAPPEWEAIKDDILAQRCSVQEGVGRLFSLLPSSLKEEIIHFLLQTARIRDGFREFVAFFEREGYSALHRERRHRLFRLSAIRRASGKRSHFLQWLGF